MPGVTNPPDRPVHPSERRGGRRHRFWVLAVGTAVAALLLTAGCSSDDGDDDSTSTTTVAETTTTAPESTSTTTTEPRTPEEKVEEAYWEAVAVLDDVLQAPDPGDERLGEVMADPLLDHVVTYLGELADEGVATRWVDEQPPPREITSIEIDNDAATVLVCEIDNPLGIDLESGEVIDDSVISAVVEVSLERSASQWKVVDSVSTSEWADGLGCDR